MKGNKHTKLKEYQDRCRKEAIPCAMCKREAWTTVDHIVPHAFIEMLGMKVEAYDHDWNFQFLCRACNTLKKASLNFTDPRTIENLKRYVALAEEIYKL
jgi:5-methylcytosine-specific restriction endonuclease McrA